MTTVLTPRPAAPSAARIALARTSLELRLFARERQLVAFSFAYPGDLLGDPGQRRTPRRRHPVPAVLPRRDRGHRHHADQLPGGRDDDAAEVLGRVRATRPQQGLAAEREAGLLARLQVLATPPAAYFAGKAGQVLVAVTAQLALLLPVARYGYDVPMPVDLAHWLTFGWVAVLGALAGTVLGIAVSALPGSASSVTTGISALALVLQFSSGVFFGFLELPGWMQQLAALFPLKWLTQGMRSALLPERAGAFEMAGSWEHGRTVVVLLAWVIIGLVVCARTFRWRRAEG